MTLIIVLDVCKSLCVDGSMKLNYNTHVTTHEEKVHSAAEEAWVT